MTDLHHLSFVSPTLPSSFGMQYLALIANYLPNEQLVHLGD